MTTAGDAALTVHDPSATTPGHLVNGSSVLAAPLGVRAGSGAYGKTVVFTLSTAAP